MSPVRGQEALEQGISPRRQMEDGQKARCATRQGTRDQEWAWAGAAAQWPLGTHADVQVLQKVLQQAGAQGERPHPLMTPGGLDPWAQVLGEMGGFTQAPAGETAQEAGARVAWEGQRPCQATRPGFEDPQAKSGRTTCCTSPLPISVLLAWLTDTAIPGGSSVSRARRGAGCS